MRNWIDFWDGHHAIFVNDRHRRLHAELVGDAIAARIPSPTAAVLDHGCGEALYAERVARACGRLFLCEAAPGVRQRLAARTRRLGNVAVIAPEELTAIADGSLQLVVANSLVQYLSRDELGELLAQWRRVLHRGGELVIADVVPRRGSMLGDVSALLRFGWRGGFLVAAVAGMLRTGLSDYRRLRARAGFSCYGEGEFLSLLSASRFRAARLQPGFGHDRRRMTFGARPA